MLSTVYLALDVHVAHTVLGQMDAKGTFLGSRRFATTAEELTAALRSLQARRKLLTLEEGPLARWVAQLARPLCAQVLVCDPRHNRLITQAARKDDEADVRSLCRLLRLGELHEVHHPRDEGRAVFKAALREDQRLKRHEVWCQLQIKALYRGWGVLHFSGNAVYRPATRAGFLERIAQPPIRDQLARLYALLDTAVALRTQCWSQIATLGRAEPIIAEFQKVPGVGPIGAHLFAAFIQEPARFASKQALWRYARLSIVCSAAAMASNPATNDWKGKATAPSKP